MKDYLRRAIRTFAQGFVGILALTAIPALNSIVSGVVSGGGNDVEIDLNLWRNIALAAIAGGLVSLISLLQNWLEDNTRFPAVLKSAPSSGQNPVTQDRAV